MNEDPTLNAQFRLMALETLMIEMLSREYLKTGNSAVAAAEHRANLRKLFSEVAFPGFDAALSDFVIGEVGDAVDRIVEEAGRAASRIAGGKRQP
jgi:hypothetical protein